MDNYLFGACAICGIDILDHPESTPCPLPTKDEQDFPDARNKGPKPIGGKYGKKYAPKETDSKRD